MEEFRDYLRLINNCDAGAPLLSSTRLGQRLDQILLCHVELSDLLDLTQALNVEQLVPTEDGLARDYRGLAELMGFNSVQVEAKFKRTENPTRSQLDAFISKNSSITLNGLLKLIERIERFDVIDDFMPTLIRLASNFDKNLDQYNHDRIQQEVVSDLDQLTVDDRPNGFMVTYDAFICHAPEDMEYAQQLKALLELKGKSVVTADDLLPGQFEYDAFIRLIDGRCRKVISLLTPNFSRSKACEFQTKFATEVGLKSDCRKIIPVLYEACDDSKLPSMIKVLTKIDMTSKGSHQWQLERLVRSLAPPASSNAQQFYSTQQPHMIESTTAPAIIVSDRTTQGDDAPIVELMHSQNSSAISTSNVASINEFQPLEERFNIVQQNSKVATGLKWIKPLRRFMNGITGPNSVCESTSPTTSSQALLISSNSSDLSHEDSKVI